MTPAEKEILGAVQALTKEVQSLHAAFDELTLTPELETTLDATLPDPARQHFDFATRAQRRYEATRGTTDV